VLLLHEIGLRGKSLPNWQQKKGCIMLNGYLLKVKSNREGVVLKSLRTGGQRYLSLTLTKTVTIYVL